MADEILQLSQQLLDAIGAGDYATYSAMCDPSITCFEPEALGFQVQGLPFHKYYFEMPSSNPNPDVKAHVLNTMSSPHVRLIGDSCAVVSYVRLKQVMSGGSPVTQASEETRVWEKKDGKWLHVHMHRSPVSR